jgi:hypothetical protein
MALHSFEMLGSVNEPHRILFQNARILYTHTVKTSHLAEYTPVVNLLYDVSKDLNFQPRWPNSSWVPRLFSCYRDQSIIPHFLQFHHHILSKVINTILESHQILSSPRADPPHPAWTWWYLPEVARNSPESGSEFSEADWVLMDEVTFEKCALF